MIQLNAEKIKLFGQIEKVKGDGIMIRIVGEANSAAITSDINKTEWLPKSQIKIVSDTHIQDLVPGDEIIFLLPAWIALERGLFDD